MNDEDQEEASVSGWSSRTDGASTATAEPVDRRWFEEALRAQGFLVEPPTIQIEDTWPGTTETDVPDAPVVPLDIDLDLDPDLDDGPLVAEPVPKPEPVPDPVPELVAEPALEPAPELAPKVAATVLPDSDRPAAPTFPAPSVTSAWPALEAMPTHVAPAPESAAVEPPSAATTRHAVVPRTLPDDRPPVPTGALAVRLSRSTPAVGSGAVATVATAETATELITPTEPGPTAIAAQAPASTAPRAPDVPPGPAVTEAPLGAISDPWTLPALKADLVAERASGTSVLDDEAPSAFIIAATAAEVTSIGTDAAAASAAVDLAPAVEAAVAVEPPSEMDLAPAVEAAVAVEPPSAVDLAPAVGAAVAVEPAGAMFEFVEPAGTTAADVPETVIREAPPSGVEHAAEAIVQPATVSQEPGRPPATAVAGIAAIAPRPPITSPGTSVDGGESELWGLVGATDKAATAKEPTSSPRASSRITTALLTVFVAIVVVVLVLGFIYLFTNLL